MSSHNTGEITRETSTAEARIREIKKNAAKGTAAQVREQIALEEERGMRTSLEAMQVYQQDSKELMLIDVAYTKDGQTRFEESMLQLVHDDKDSEEKEAYFIWANSLNEVSTERELDGERSVEPFDNITLISEPIAVAMRASIKAVLTGTLTEEESRKLEEAKLLVKQALSDGNFDPEETQQIVAAFDAAKLEGLLGK